ncbi:phage terminase large subunit family protein [Pseudomonas sp. Irchel s3a18]|uniref:phage terminase large subunit family protein n=1 Tax=Pseudomonas sp. Irchel s3a18 TaxID=2009053 RepID=UPI000BA2DA6F|nr:terminase gpA endonuclease subunit [Pseudomonas sp. Irchel s3a18]
MNTLPPWMRGLTNAVTRGLTALFKEPPLTAVEWADKHFYLSSESSYQEGRWETAPFQVALLNAMGNDLIREVNVLKSARVGYTKMLVANMGYKIQHKKRNLLSWCPDDGSSDELMKRHIDTMIRDVPVVRALAPWFDKKHSDNTLDAKCFDNQKMLWCLGGKAAKNYREKSPDEVIYDELSKFDADIEGEGAPTLLGDKRLEGATFKKSIRGSTPGTADTQSSEEDGGGDGCQITRAANESPHFLRFNIRCPCCDTEQHLKWGGLDAAYGVKWLKDGYGQVEKAWYLCESGHGCTFEYHEMIEASKQGRYLCERSGIWTRDSMEWFSSDDQPIATPRSITFHIWTIYSTFTTWADIVSDWLKVGKDRGKLKTFTNTTLGEAWEEDQSEKLNWELLRDRREVFAQVPRRAVALLGGIDTQGDRYEGRVYAYGAGEEAWLVHRFILTGDPASTVLLKKVGQEINRQFTRADGTLMRVERWCWDSGGHYADEVRAESRKYGVHWVIPIFGASTYGKPIANFPRKKDKRSKVYLTEVGTDNAKELIYSRLKLQPDGDRPAPGCIHFPADDLICDDDELKQLTSESKKWVIVKGRRVMRWDASKRRNEALDCAVYALAALRISQQRFGLDLDLLAKQLPGSNQWLVPEPEDAEPAAPVATSVPQAQQPAPPAESGGWFDSGQDAWL